MWTAVVTALLAGVCVQTQRMVVEPAPRPAVRGVVGCAHPRRPPGQRGAERFKQWQFWWAANQDALLDLRGRKRGGIRSRWQTGFAAAHGQQVGDALDAMRDDLLPALMALLGESDADLCSAAAIALGCTAPASATAPVRGALSTLLASSSKSVQQAAALALGLLGDRNACAMLAGVMHDTKAGREICHRRDAAIPGEVRAHAALALGYLGDPTSIAPLQQAIVASPSEKEIAACAITALGLFPMHQEEVMSVLLAQMQRVDLDRLVRAQIPIAMARLGPASGRACLLLDQTLRDASTPLDVLRSTAIALGKIATIDRSSVVADLMQLATDHEDAQLRNFALIAIGEIAGRAPHVEQVCEPHRKMLAFLTAAIERPQPRVSLPWAALALALGSRTSAASASASEVLEQAFARSTDASEQGAIALALGLLGDHDAGQALTAVMMETADARLAGAIAVALGKMAYPAALDWIRAQIARPDLEWQVRLDLARALALMHDAAAVAPVIADMNRATSLSRTSADTMVLALLGDRAAFDALRTVMLDVTRPAKVRAFAVRELGRLAERSELPWAARIATGNNYRAKTVVLADVIDQLE